MKNGDCITLKDGDKLKLKPERSLAYGYGATGIVITVAAAVQFPGREKIWIYDKLGGAYKPSDFEGKIET